MRILLFHSFASDLRSFAPGKAVPVTIGLGLKITDYFGLELGFDGILGLNTKTSGNSADIVTKTSGYLAQIVPSIVISSGFAKVNTYMRLGYSIGLNQSISYMESGKNSTGFYEYRGIFEGGTPIGFMIACGVNFKVSKFIRIFTEVIGNGINYKPKSFNVTEYNINGSDHLQDLTTKQKEISLVNNVNPNEALPDSGMDKKLRQTFPFSNIQLSIGIQVYNLF